MASTVMSRLVGSRRIVGTRRSLSDEFETVSISLSGVSQTQESSATDRGDITSGGVMVLEERVKLSRPPFDPVTFFNAAARSEISTPSPKDDTRSFFLRRLKRMYS